MPGQEAFTVRHLQAPDGNEVLSLIAGCRREYGLNGRVRRDLGA
jgi:hypothetical protein